MIYKVTIINSIDDVTTSVELDSTVEDIESDLEELLDNYFDNNLMDDVDYYIGFVDNGYLIEIHSTLDSEDYYGI